MNQLLPLLFLIAEVYGNLQDANVRIAQLEQEIAALRAQGAGPPG